MPKKPQQPAADDRTTAYARAVVSGQVLTGRHVRLACERHLRDLETGHERGLRFDVKKAQRRIEYNERFLCLAGGEHEGRPFLLQPWQAFIEGSLFGWLGPDGYRRFRDAYVETAKGNGKSPELASTGLYMMSADNEARAECYACASKKDQAHVQMRDAVAMVDQSPALAGRLVKSGASGREWNLAHLPTGSFYRTLASGDGQSGPRVHFAGVDELHEHPDATLVDMMRAGTKGRRQALIYKITNSGSDRTSVCWAHHEQAVRVLEGTEENDALFAYVCGLDPCEKCRAEGKVMPVEECEACDDWRDEAVWPKANPNLGVSVTVKYLRELVRDAETMPSKKAVVQRLNFCIWTEHAEPFFAMDLWDACGQRPVVEAGLVGQSCYGGLDLASKIDTASFGLVFEPDEDDIVRALWRIWIPKATLARRLQKEKTPWLLWIDQGYVIPTEGDVIDFDAIKDEIRELAKRFQILEIGFDPWNATQLATQLEAEGATMVEVPQTMRHLSEPTKELEARIISGRFAHGGNPVTRWMANNCAGIRDGKDNVLLSKKKSTGKIDGIAATVTALSRLICRPPETASVYETRGMVRV